MIFQTSHLILTFKKKNNRINHFEIEKKSINHSLSTQVRSKFIDLRGNITRRFAVSGSRPGGRWQGTLAVGSHLLPSGDV